MQGCWRANACLFLDTPSDLKKAGLQKCLKSKCVTLLWHAKCLQRMILKNDEKRPLFARWGWAVSKAKKINDVSYEQTGWNAFLPRSSFRVSCRSPSNLPQSHRTIGWEEACGSDLKFLWILICPWTYLSNIQDAIDTMYVTTIIEGKQAILCFIISTRWERMTRGSEQDSTLDAPSFFYTPQELSVT